MQFNWRDNTFHKSLFFFILLFFSATSFSQTPPNNLSGDNLKTWLKANWYDGFHTTLGYDGVNGARSYMYNIIDNYNDTVTCVYSGLKQYRAYDLTRAAGTIGMTPINCEHSIPQSFFSYLEPMKSDIHHLYPTYGNWNSTRSNNPFGEIDDAQTDKWMYLTTSQTTIPTANIELFSEYDAGVFEPREDHKGDLARAIFYFYTMYPTEAGALSLLGDLDTFYQWHLTDTPTAKEYGRDDDIYLYQGNSNPYLTHPEWIVRTFDLGNLPPPELTASATSSEITLDWGDMPSETGYKIFRSTDSITFTQVGVLQAANTVTFTDNTASQSTIYYYYLVGEYSGVDSEPGPAISMELLPPGPPTDVTDLALTATTTSLDLAWSDVTGETAYQIYRSSDNITFTTLGSTLAANTISYSDNTALTGTTYYYYIVASNNDGSSNNGNTVSGQLLENSAAATDLIISEYVEGSSYNKAIEIANFTGATIDLANYELGKQTNGAGGWTTLSLSGNLADGATYVIVDDASSNTTLTSKADLLTSSSVLNFNGNDPMALFSKVAAPATIIDIVGVENAGSGNFAKDVTLQRVPAVTEPNNAYTTTEWMINSVDDFSDLGTHTMNLSAPLPVELASFTAKELPQGNMISWTTFSELNHEKFILEHSEDGRVFKNIHEKIGEGNSNHPKYYKFLDKNSSPLSYYRLQQKDFDNTITFSEIIVVERNPIEQTISVSPVPTSDFVNLNIISQQDIYGEIKLYDISGKMVKTISVNVQEGHSDFQIDLRNLEDGVYVLALDLPNSIIRKRIVKLGKY